MGDFAHITEDPQPPLIIRIDLNNAVHLLGESELKEYVAGAAHQRVPRARKVRASSEQYHADLGAAGSG